MNWYEIKNKSEKAEIWIYDFIGEDFWSGGGVTAKNFQKELAEIKASQIDLHINSPGGDVFDGIAIYNLLKQHAATVTTYIDGLAASIASVIALSGDKIYMAENALFMIHNPWGSICGEAADMRKFADQLDMVRGAISKSYAAKTGKEESEINSLMDAETWMDADDAVEAGFVDEVTEKMDMAACAKFVPILAKARFKHIPAFAAKDAEKALRNAGFSRKEAKSILAKGLSEGLRDAGPAESLSVAVESQRDVELPRQKRDRIAELLTKAEIVAPSIN